MRPRCTPEDLDLWGESSYLGRATCGIWCPGGAAGREADTDRHPRSPRPPSSSAGSPVLSPHAPQTPQRGKIPVSLRKGGSLRPFSGFVLSVTHSCPVGKVGRGKKKKTETERTWAPAAPPCFPDDAGIRAAGVHRSHLRCHFSLNSTGTVRKIGVSSRGRSGGGRGGPPLLSLRWNHTETPASVRASLRPAITHSRLAWSEQELIHLSVSCTYRLILYYRPQIHPYFCARCVSSLWIFRDHLGRWAAKSAYYPSMDSLSAAEINSLIDFCERPRLPSANKLDGLNVSH